MAVNDYTSDGYVMLYHLLKNVHPKLQRNKATKPSMPSFNGNVGQYVLRYQNWLKYQISRPQPHIYDDDEIADDFLQAVKTPPWGSKLTKGIEFIEAKLDRWKNTAGMSFPSELTLDFIGHTLMIPYIEANEDPLTIHRDNRPAARAYMTRGRSRSNGRGRDRNRSNSRDSHTSQGRLCEICKTIHRPSTTGCPNLHRHIQVQTWLENASQEEVQRHLDRVDQARRERSHSRESQRSNTSQRSQHSRQSNRSHYSNSSRRHPSE